MSKEHDYAYEAGYRDGSINYELEHCPACKNVADLQEALDENARLRSELESVGIAAYLYGRTDLADENAKLRELARELWDGYEDPPCEDCPLQDKSVCVDCPICAREAAVIDRMRELRIEMD